jgi:hypothetical protein
MDRKIAVIVCEDMGVGLIRSPERNAGIYII